MKIVRMESSHDAASSTYIDHYAIFSPGSRNCNTILAYPTVFLVKPIYPRIVKC